MADKITFTCPEREHGCEFSTKSETKFVAHLIDVHAFRPGQVGRVLAKIKKQIALRMPSGFQTVIGKDRIYIKRSRTRYSAYTSEMRDSKKHSGAHESADHRTGDRCAGPGRQHH